MTETTTTPAVTTTTPAVTTATVTAPAAFDWKTTGLDDASQQYVASKGWKDIGGVVESYRNAEKLIGVSPDKVIKIPGDDKPESWAPVFDRLGRPKAPNEYKLPVPEGQDTKFAEAASAWFHEAGLTAKQGHALAAKWNEHVSGLTKAQTEQAQAAAAAEASALKAEWGGEYDVNVMAAKKAAQAFGLKPEIIDAVQKAAGFAETMKFFRAIGTKVAAEGAFHGSDNRSGGFAMTPEQARGRMAELKADRAWTQKWAAGDADARRLMDSLQRAAFAQG